MLDVAEKLMKCGALELDPETRVLSGPRGQVRLAPAAFAISERLMRRPGAVIETGSLISAVWPDPDREPENADYILKNEIKRIRGFLALAGCQNISIRCERTIGYFIERRGQ